MMKKLISLLLILALVATIIPTAVAESPAVLPEQDIGSVGSNAPQINGSNSVGDLFAAAVSENNAVDEDAPDHIAEITIEGKTATVTMENEHLCKVVVGVYDEAGKTMVTSGTSDYLAQGTTEAKVTLSADPPQYFFLRAFLLDADVQPLTKPFESDHYTKDYQDFLKKTTADFSAASVLNFDADKTNNFAVYAPGVIKITSGSANVLSSYSGNTCKFNSIDSTIRALKKGDVIHFTDKAGEPQVLKIASITISGSSATITKDENLTLDEAFSYVKIDLEADSANAKTDTSTADTGVSVKNVDLTETGAEGSFNVSQSYSLEKVFGAVKVSGTIEVGVEFRLKISKDKNIFDVSLTAEASDAIYVRVTGKLEKEITLGKIVVPCGMTGVSTSVDVKFVVEVSAEIEMNLTATGTAGFAYNKKTGFKNLSSDPTAEAETKVVGKFFAGIKIAPAISALFGVVTLSMPVRAGAEVTAEYSLTHPSGTEAGHKCSRCIKGEVEGVVEVSVELKARLGGYNEVLTTKFGELRIKLFDFYYSFDIGWGKGTCPNNRAPQVEVEPEEISKELQSGDASPVQYDCIDSLTINGSGRFDNYVLLDGIGEYMKELKELYDNEQISKAEYDRRSIELSDIKNVTISGFTTISNCATGETHASIFGAKTNLENLTITGSVKSIEYRAFAECRKLKSVSLPSSITYIGRSAFFDCRALSSISLPSSLEHIGLCAFAGCTALTSITIPHSVKFIDGMAFAKSGLTGIEIPANVEHIACAAFADCPAMTSATLNSEAPNAFMNCKTLTNVTIGSNVKKIGDLAFWGCSNLQSITIPSSVSVIGSGAFEGTGISSINLPDSLSIIGSGAFRGCKSLTSVTIPNSITTINSCTFSGCSALHSVKLPETLLAIECEAFSGCTSLSSITLPKSLQYLYEPVFYGCSSLRMISFSGSKDDWDNLIIGYSCDITGSLFDELDSLYNGNLSKLVEIHKKMKSSVEDNSTSAITTYGHAYFGMALHTFRSNSDRHFDEYRMKDLDRYMSYINKAISIKGYTETPASYIQLAQYFCSKKPAPWVSIGGKKTTYPSPWQNQYSYDCYHPYKTGVTVKCQSDDQPEIDEPDDPDPVEPDPDNSDPDTGDPEDNNNSLLPKTGGFRGVALNGKTSIKFTGLQPNTDYLLAIEDISTKKPLENAAYLAQATSDAAGTVTFSIFGSFDTSRFRANVYGSCSHSKCHYEQLPDNGGQIKICDICHNALPCIIGGSSHTTPTTVQPTTKPTAQKLVGDADNDGDVTIVDATRIQRWLAELCNMDGKAFTGAALTAQQKKMADADGDGDVTILDATAIQRWIADLGTNQGIGKPIG